MRLLIFGNSGSGKSTLARYIAMMQKTAHLDLDTLAWSTSKQANAAPCRAPLAEVEKKLNLFCSQQQSWVIEGCYSDILQLLTDRATDMVFLALPIQACIDNAKQRPWEPHKYKTKQQQDDNLPMLIQWISDYQKRTDEFSESAHQQLFDSFTGHQHKFTQQQSPNDYLTQLLANH